MIPFRCLFVCLSVCHVRALCSNGRRYRHDLLRICIYDSPCVFEIFLKFGSTFSPQIFSQSDPPLLTWASETFNGNCGWIIRDSAMVTMASLWKPPLLFRMIPLLTSYDLPLSPKCGSQMHRHVQFRDACCHHWGTTSPLVELLWPSLLLLTNAVVCVAREVTVETRPGSNWVHCSSCLRWEQTNPTSRWCTSSCK